MDKEIHPGIEISFLLFLGLFVFLPPMVWAGETPTRVIEEAKFAIDQARKAGAEQQALDYLSAAKSWLSRAEKEYSEARSFFSRMSSEKTQKAKGEEIIYLATMLSEKRAQKVREYLVAYQNMQPTRITTEGWRLP